MPATCAGLSDGLCEPDERRGEGSLELSESIGEGNDED